VGYEGEPKYQPKLFADPDYVVLDSRKLYEVAGFEPQPLAAALLELEATDEL
jgi:hypothetical protein